jgi:hypothetical protein
MISTDAAFERQMPQAATGSYLERAVRPMKFILIALR